jgi:hypothetical protein
MFDFGVFCNSGPPLFHVKNFKHHNIEEWSVYYMDHSFFLSTHHKKNVAVLHWPYPTDRNFDKMVGEIFNKCDHIYVVISELHRPSIEFMQTFDHEKITYYVAGTVTAPINHATVKHYHNWFDTSRYFYRDYLPEILHRLTTESKPHTFDMLLGRKKPHRDYMYQHALTMQDADRVLRYFDNETPCLDDDDSHWVTEQQGMRSHGPLTWTVDRVDYYGYEMSISQIIPIEVYNQTAFTVVAETNWDNYYAFFTEKTAKPIIARRMFVMAAGAGYLSALRSMGFQTFGDIIDESYDAIENHQERWQAVCNTINWICQQDQGELLKKVQPIVEHNFMVMMSRDWYGEFNNDLEARIGPLAEQTRR